MKFSAWVKADDETWIYFDVIRWISLDENGYAERICGPTGIQYNEFRLEVKMDQ